MKVYVYIVAILIACLATVKPVAADSTSCNGEQAVQSEAFSTPDDTYDVYVKTAIPGQNTSATVYLSSEGCRLIGGIQANDITWSKAGMVTISATTPVSFEIDGIADGVNDSAARPQILLVPINMPCIPSVACNTTISGESAYLIPNLLTTTASGLLVERVADPAKDATKEVQYYADGQLMYTKKQLEPYNLAYADYYQQKIARVVVYESKQRAVIESAVPSDYSDTIPNAAMRLYVRQAVLLNTIGISLFISLLIISVRTLVQRYDEAEYYNYAHGLGRWSLAPWKLKLKSFVQNSAFRLASTGIVTILLIASVVVTLNTFVIAPYRVDGVSMMSTLQNKQLMPINKLPVSLNRQFKPVRGQIIVFHPNYGNLAYSSLRVDTILVKRIVGLPGERIVSENGKLKVFTDSDTVGRYAEDTEPWGKKVTLQPNDQPFDITLSNDQIFVAGDNRPHSIDSRINGALPLSEVIGVVVGY